MEVGVGPCQLIARDDAFFFEISEMGCMGCVGGFYRG
jgi:hypothetical protein